MRGLIGVAVALIVMMPSVALAQSPDRPVVELGVQGSKRINDRAPIASALRLTVPLKRRTAIEVTSDIHKFVFEKEFGGDTRISAREFSVHWRQTVFASGRLQVFGVLGAGTNRVETNVPERIFQTKDGPRVTPADRWVTSEFVGHFGPAVQVELAPWLALRGDLRGTLGSQDSGVRYMVGAVIPIRRSRDSDRPGAPAPAPAPAPATAIPNAKPQPAQSTPPPDKWRRLKPGREVWVTTNTGSLVHGEIAAISDSSLSIREQDREVPILLDDVRLVEGRDGLKNGFLIGTVPGAVAGGLLGRDFASALCSGSTTCDPSADTYVILIGAVGGAVVGGFFGMMVDALIPGRQTLLRGSTTLVMPVLTPTKKAIDVRIRWP